MGISKKTRWERFGWTEVDAAGHALNIDPKSHTPVCFRSPKLALADASNRKSDPKIGKVWVTFELVKGTK